MKKIVIGVMILVAIYFCSYLVVRQSYAQVWEQDNNIYVLFPNAPTYYLYRPLTYPDAMITGMRFHIGPHR